MLFSTMSAFGLAMVIYVSVHKDGPIKEAIIAFCTLGVGVGNLITINSKDE